MRTHSRTLCAHAAGLIASNLPTLARLYHRGCFVCTDSECSGFHASGLVLLESKDKLICRRHITPAPGLGAIARPEASARLSGNLIAERLRRPGRAPQTRGGGGRNDAKPEASPTRPAAARAPSPDRARASSSKAPAFIKLNLLDGTKARAKEIFAQWSKIKAEKEAEKKAHLREMRPAAAPAAAPVSDKPPSPAGSPVRSRLMSSAAFLRAAAQGVTQMINTISTADPGEKIRHYDSTDHSTSAVPPPWSSLLQSDGHAAVDTPFEITEFCPFQFDYLRRSFGLEPSEFAKWVSISAAQP